MYDWGLNLIRSIQSVSSPVLTAFVKGITFLGNPEFCIAVFVFLLWCVDEKKGFRLAVLLGFSGGLNVVIKNALQIPRPFELDPSVKLLDAKNFSTPSGHAQNSAIMWPFFAKNIHFLQKKRFLILKNVVAVLLPLLIGFSRVYLGVHYPSDVLIGWFIGFLFILISFLFWQKVSLFFEKLQHSLKILFCFAPCFLLLYIDKSQIEIPAFLFGFTIGRVFINEKGGFSAADGKIYQKIIRLIVGVSGAIIIYFVLNFAKEFHQISRYVIFIQFLFLGWWLTFGAPVIFGKLHLTGVKKAESTEEINNGEKNDK
jgi:membrane-associated phospholipid phosphatase